MPASPGISTVRGWWSSEDFGGRTFASWSGKIGAESLLPVWTHSARGSSLSYIAHDAAFARGFLLPGPIIAKCAGMGRMERWRGRVWNVLMWTNTSSADSAACPEAKSRSRTRAQSMGMRQKEVGTAECTWQKSAEWTSAKESNLSLLVCEALYTHTLSVHSVRQID